MISSFDKENFGRPGTPTYAKKKFSLLYTEDKTKTSATAEALPFYCNSEIILPIPALPGFPKPVQNQFCPPDRSNVPGGFLFF